MADEYSQSRDHLFIQVWDRMNSYRLLHVEDEPDIREVVEISLSPDAGITLMSCPSGVDALVTAAD
jgi:CheY-like chemotaxis protein